MRNSFLFIPILLLGVIVFSSLRNYQAPGLTKPSFSTYHDIIEWMDNPTDDHIMVVAHRGDWRNAPENSIQAVLNCIEMGIEIVEIDIRMTKDSQLIVIHDKTLDRTTTGKGKNFGLDFSRDQNSIFKKWSKWENPSSGSDLKGNDACREG